MWLLGIELRASRRADSALLNLWAISLLKSHSSISRTPIGWHTTACNYPSSDALFWHRWAPATRDPQRQSHAHTQTHTQKQNKKILKLNQCLKFTRKLRRQVSRQSACSSMRIWAWIPRIYVKPGTDSHVHNPSASTVRCGAGSRDRIPRRLPTSEPGVFRTAAINKETLSKMRTDT